MKIWCLKKSRIRNLKTIRFLKEVTESFEDIEGEEILFEEIKIEELENSGAKLEEMGESFEEIGIEDIVIKKIKNKEYDKDDIFEEATESSEYIESEEIVFKKSPNTNNNCVFAALMHIIRMELQSVLFKLFLILQEQCCYMLLCIGETIHASDIPLVLNLHTGAITSQLHEYLMICFQQFPRLVERAKKLKKICPIIVISYV